MGTVSAALVLLGAAALPAFGQQFVTTGTYTGDGHSLRGITGVGFQPDLVIVKSSNSEVAYCKTATMAGARSKSLGTGDATKTDRITSLDPDGFSVAGTREVNEAGVVYTWVAMKASSGLMNLGSYVGNDAAFRFIGGAAFAPDAVLVMTDDSKVAVLRTATMPLSVSLALAGGQTFSDRILNTGLGGFFVGSRDEVNKGGQTYHFVAWNAADRIAAAGDYTGDGNAGRSITGAGFTPAWVLLASEDEASAVHRPAALGAGDVTQFFNKTANSGGLITSLAADGFTVGGADAANAVGSHFNWLAFQEPINLVELGLSAAATPVTAAVGDTVRFTYDLANGSVSDATNVEIATELEAGLTFEGYAASAGTYDTGLGIWNLGAVTAGGVESLVLVATIDPGQEGRRLTGTATISAVDQPDPIPDNDKATATVTVLVPTPAGIRLQAVGGEPVGALPGDPTRRLLAFELINVGATPDTLRSLRVANLTEGSGTAAELDAEWAGLELAVGAVRSPADAPPTTAKAFFAGGQTDFSGFAAPLAPGDTLLVTVAGAPSLAVRDGIEMRLGVRQRRDIGLASTIYDDETWPLATGHRLDVDGFVSAQATVHQVAHRLLGIGSVDNLAFDITLPANGYLVDSLYGISLANFGSAEPGTEIARMRAWLDDGDGLFLAAADDLLGQLVHSGDRWQVTGLAATVPPGGIRVFITVDIAETARPAREIRLGLPVVHGPSVVMLSGNDGPVDRSLDNSSSLGISAGDRVILTTGSIQPAVTRPGARGVVLLDLILTNTYAVDHALRSLAVTNASAGAAGATVDQLDGTLRQVMLRIDADDDGVLDDLLTDPALGAGAFVAGRADFQGLNLVLPAGSSRRLFVTGDVSLTGASDGDRLSAVVGQGNDVLIGGASVVAIWPLDSASEWHVDGMVRDQLTLRPIPVRSLGPDAMGALALDLQVPPNGYQPDRLLGLTVRNIGTAVPSDLAQTQLWRDGGNGFYDAGSLDDALLGTMVYSNGAWRTPLLGEDIGPDGLRVYLSVDVGGTPSDSATVRLAVPLGGVVTASGNTGPLDRECVESGTLVLSTSPLHSTMVFATAATTVGQSGSIRMVVQNSGTSPVYGVSPTLQDPLGDAILDIGAPTPAGLDIGVGQEAQFAWSFTATGPGTVALSGSAAGLGGGGESFASVPTPTPQHTVYTPATSIELYPVTNLPTSVSRGQEGLVPMTLTLVNPGDDTGADVELGYLRLRLTETPGGAGIVPADLLQRLVISEGTDVYASFDTLPTFGSDIDIVLDPPALVTGREPVSLGVRLDLRLNTTAPSFVVAIEDASFFAAVDAISGAGVPVAPAGGTYPVRTSQANLVSPAGSLTVSLPDGPVRSATPGQTGVGLAEFGLTNPGSDSSSSAITMSQLAFVLRDTFGVAVPAPAARFTRMVLRSAYQEHFHGQPTVLGDTLVVMNMSTPAIIGSNANMTLELLGDFDADAGLGVIMTAVSDANRILASDANTGQAVPVTLGVARAGPRVAVLGPPGSPLAVGAGRLPATVSAGLRDLTVMNLFLTHAGPADASPVALDSLILALLDEARQPLDPAAILDRLRVLAGPATLGDLVDPTGPGGRLRLPLGGVVLMPGQSLDLEILADLLPWLTAGSCEFLLAAGDIHGHGTTDGTPVVASGGGGTWPLSSGLARIVVPAEELAVRGEDRMPPLLAPAESAYEVLTLTLRNTASPSAGDIALRSLTVSQPAPTAGAVDLGRALDALTVLIDGVIVGTAVGIDPSGRSATVAFIEPVLVPAAGTIDLLIAITVRTDAPAGTLTLQIDDTGIAAGPPGVPPGGIRIVPAPGTALPVTTSAGNLSTADLEASYLNFPNPFAAGREPTTFAFALVEGGRVTLKLYTPHGEAVATVIDAEDRPAGFFQADTWDGRNGRGEIVRNGVYLAEIVVEFASGKHARLLRKVAVVR